MVGDKKLSQSEKQNKKKKNNKKGGQIFLSLLPGGLFNSNIYRIHAGLGGG